MGQLLLVLVVALIVGGIVFGVAVLITGTDRGLGDVEPDGRALPLPVDRPLIEGDVARVRFDAALRGYRMAQVDQALRRAAYDIGYKDELISVLEAEIVALRAGRIEDAEVLRRAREAALAGTAAPASPAPALGAAGVESALGVTAATTVGESGAGTSAAEPGGQTVPEPGQQTVPELGGPTAAEPGEPDQPAAEPPAAATEPDEPTAQAPEPTAQAQEPTAVTDDNQPDQADIEPDSDPNTDVDTDADTDAGAAVAAGAEAPVVDARSARP